jgi:hypothetical protein
MGASDFGERQAPIPVTQYPGAVDLDRATSDLAALQLCPAHAGAHSFDDETTLQFSDCSDDYDHGASERPSRVDVLPKG